MLPLAFFSFLIVFFSSMHCNAKMGEGQGDAGRVRLHGILSFFLSRITKRRAPWKLPLRLRRTCNCRSLFETWSTARNGNEPDVLPLASAHRAVQRELLAARAAPVVSSRAACADEAAALQPGHVAGPRK